MTDHHRLSAPYSLSALLASRICHDLISPIGAISNGLELLSMSGNPAAGPEMALIGDSVSQANARIRLYRIAFGIASDGQWVGRQELVNLLADLTTGLRLRVEWHIPDEVARPDAKLAVLCLMCLETAMPYGGCIRMNAGADGWQIEGESPRLKVDPDLWRAFATNTLHITAPAQVQFALARQEAETLGRVLAVGQGRDSLRVSF